MRETFEEFSLLGGPFHRLGRRLGLVHGRTNTFALGIALGAFLWTVFAALALIEGIGHQVFSLSVIGAHARLLLAIPLFFLCEAWVDPRMTAFVRGIVRAEVVPSSALPALHSEIARIVRLKDSWVPDAVCLLAAVLFTVMGPHLHLSGASATQDPSRAVGEMLLTGQWYWLVCLTLFRFLMFRWLWRLGLWYRFLWRVSRLPLHLVPTHPDGVAGIGSLEGAHTQFIPIVLAISIVQAGAFAEASQLLRLASWV